MGHLTNSQRLRYAFTALEGPPTASRFEPGAQQGAPSPHCSPRCLSHPAPRAFAAIWCAGLLDRLPQARLRGPARNLAPNSLRIGARHPALVNNAG
jgi:hypothetical protein